MADLPVIQLPLPEEEQPKTLYARITNVNEPPKFDDIRNSNLSREEKVRQIQYRTKAYQDDVDRELHKNYARIGLGGLVSAVGALPIAITKNPVIGSAIGGGVYELGQGIMEGDELPELMQRSGFGAAIGGAAGGVVSKAPQAAKFVDNLSGERIGNALKPIGEKFANTKLYDALMTDVRAFNPNKQTVYHGSPYDFEKFSNEAIGTGEGAQAHGYGHYAAKNKNVAERYAETISGEKPIGVRYKGENYEVGFNPEIADWEIKGNVESLTPEERHLFQLIDSNRNLEDIKGKEQKNIDRLIRMKGRRNRFRDAQKSKDIINLIDNNEVEILPENKQLYKLSIPKDDVMLREDALMSNQPNMSNLWDEIRLDRVNKSTTSLPKFKMALGANDIDIDKTFNTKYFNDALEMVKNNPEQYKDLFLKDMTGKELYGYLESVLGSRKAATEYLQQRGIKGISYNGGIDGEARVIFNPDDIVIGRKYHNQPNLYQQLTGKQNTGALVDALFNR